MTATECLEFLSHRLTGDDGMVSVEEVEYEPPFAGVWITVHETGRSSRFIIRVEEAV